MIFHDGLIWALIVNLAHFVLWIKVTFPHFDVRLCWTVTSASYDIMNGFIYHSEATKLTIKDSLNDFWAEVICSFPFSFVSLVNLHTMKVPFSSEVWVLIAQNDKCTAPRKRDWLKFLNVQISDWKKIMSCIIVSGKCLGWLDWQQRLSGLVKFGVFLYQSKPQSFPNRFSADHPYTESANILRTFQIC